MSASPHHESPESLIPAPATVRFLGGPVRIPAAGLRTGGRRPDVDQIGDRLAEGLGVERTESPSAAIVLTLDGEPSLGGEGYELVAADDQVTIRAHRPAGLFYGGQTLVQLLPPRLGSPLEMPAVYLRDTPRFAWRGLMIDVARHFFGVDDIKRVIDLAASYKLNVVHLHLTDDQGWRIAIDRWPDLTAVGARTQVGGGAGGHYSKTDFAEIVDHAADRYVTVVPEIDVPGHTNAALTAYPELTCDGRAPAPFTGIEVGFSSLCVDKPVTRRFLADVFGEVAAMTPGGYVHLGGDEALTLPAESYRPFVAAVQEIVHGTGKTPVGWQEVAVASLRPGTVVQYWNTREGPAAVVDAVRRGAHVILSPADRVYLDMKYDAATRLGQDWAGRVDVRTAYDWEPAIDGIAERAVLGVEAALWTETISTVDEMEFMLLPRLAAVAERAWSAPASRDWTDFRGRLARHGLRWTALGVNFHRSAEVDWAAVAPL